MQRAFPWDDAIGFGLGIMHLPPSAFWAMTPRELAAAMSVVQGHRTGPPPRAALRQMLSAFPDTPCGKRVSDHG
ncbi:MAG: phage tail assembly chaperone [Roseitalea sp.]|jgi:uncharacterized phage protein (TIGR02216 family)|nr:phage tail assembly chaperone [Roseitalea sp.]MBO6720532.1 phage tail assembly chaperone [Roseitalea sp.]MBO6743679.1 phage tail assembly chaperone [Roseitalea sp.]